MEKEPVKTLNDSGNNVARTSAIQHGEVLEPELPTQEPEALLERPGVDESNEPSLKDRPSDWIDNERWIWAQQHLPILCVDILLLRRELSGETQVWLIRRPTPWGTFWNLVGGRVRLGESLEEAVQREWRMAFQNPEPPPDWHRFYVVEYQQHKNGEAPYDPRKHAVALTYVAWPKESPKVHGTEALGFRWFDAEEIRSEEIGFHQETAIHEILTKLRRDFG